MYNYLEISNRLQYKLDNNEITFEMANLVNDLAYKKYIDSFENSTYNEGVNEFKNKVIDTSNKIGSKYVNSVNKRGDKLAKVILKKPDDNASQSVLTKYENNLNKIKTAYKVGEILAINLVLLTLPFTNVPFNAGVVAGLNKSDDPSDASTRNIINKIKGFKTKVTGLNSKLKGKVITTNDDNSIKKIEVEGLNLAKEVDRCINSNKKVVAESSSTMTKLDLMILKSNYTDNDLFDALESYIINKDYNDNTYDIISDFIDKN